MQSIVRFLSVLLRVSSLALCAVSASAYAQPVFFSSSFSPDIIGPGSSSRLRFDIEHAGGSIPVTNISFSNILPAGVQIAPAANVITDCVNAIVIASPLGNQLDFSNARLAAGEDCFVQLEVLASAPGMYTNVSGTLFSDSGSAMPTSADLTVTTARPGFTQQFSPATVNQGARTRLTYRIDNTLNASIVTAVSFNDFLTPGLLIAEPANLVTTCAGATLTATPGGDRISLIGGFLLANQSCEIAVDIEAVGAGRIENVSEELFFSPGGPSQSAGRAQAVLDVALADTLVFSKAFIDDPVNAGGNVQLRYRIFNSNRSFSAMNISFSDDLDAALSGLVAVGLPLLDACGAGSTVNGTSLLSLTGGNLRPEQSCEFTLDLAVPAGASVGGYPSTTSAITGTLAGQAVVDLEASDTLYVSAAPALSMQFMPAAVGAGNDVLLEFTLTNNSALNSATAISFNYELERFLSTATVISLPPAGSCGAGSFLSIAEISAIATALFSGGNLAAGGSCSFSIGLRIAGNTPAGTYLNRTSDVSATIGGVTQLGSGASAELQVLTAPRLRLELVDNPVAPGATTTLNFELFQPEDGLTASAIQFDLDLGAALSGLSAIGLPLATPCGAMSQINGSSLLQFTGGELNPGQRCSFSVTLQVPAAANLGTRTLRSSTVDASTGGLAVSGESGMVELVVSDVGFSMEFLASPYLPGSQQTLRFTIDNSQSTATLTNIGFLHPLNTTLNGLTSVGLPLANPCGVGSTISGTTALSLTGANLLPGESCSFDVTLMIPSGARNGLYPSSTSSLQLNVNAVAASIPGATASLEVNNLLLDLVMSFNPAVAVPGGQTVLEYTLTNNSGGNVDSISFNQNLSNTLSGLVPVGLPLNDVCGMGSQLDNIVVLALSNASLAAGASCSFSVMLQVPANAAGGIYPSVTSAVSGNLQGLAVAGSAASAELQISQVQFSKSFANPVVTGQTTQLTYTISNQSSSQVLTGLRFTDDLDAVLSGLTVVSQPQINVCGLGSQLNGSSFLVFEQGSLDPGASCSFSVTVMVPPGLLPMSLLSTSSDLISGGLSLAMPAQATLEILGQADLSLSANVVNFGNVRLGTVSVDQLITLTNTGTAALDIQSLNGLTAPFALSGGDCPTVPFTLGVGLSCQLGFNFTPLVAGSANQALTLTSTSLSSPDGITLQGFAIRPLLSLSPTVLDLGPVQLGNTSAPGAVTISNSGDADLTVSTIDAVVLPFTQLAGSCATPPFTLAPAASCTLSYEFTPQAPGPAQATVNISSDAASSPDRFDLQGSGAEALIQVDSNLLDFGPRAVGGSTSLLLTLSNSGDNDLTVMGVSGPNPPFSVLPGTCASLPVVLLPSMSCALEVRFMPLDAGPVSDQFVINSDANNAPPTIQVNGQGVFLVEVPSLQRWGMLLMIFSLLAAGQVLIRRQRR